MKSEEEKEFPGLHIGQEDIQEDQAGNSPPDGGRKVSGERSVFGAGMKSPFGATTYRPAYCDSQPLPKGRPLEEIFAQARGKSKPKPAINWSRRRQAIAPVNNQEVEEDDASGVLGHESAGEAVAPGHGEEAAVIKRQHNLPVLRQDLLLALGMPGHGKPGNPFAEEFAAALFQLPAREQAVLDNEYNLSLKVLPEDEKWLSTVDFDEIERALAKAIEKLRPLLLKEIAKRPEPAKQEIKEVGNKEEVKIGKAAAGQQARPRPAKKVSPPRQPARRAVPPKERLSKQVVSENVSVGGFRNFSWPAELQRALALSPWPDFQELVSGFSKLSFSDQLILNHLYRFAEPKISFSALISEVMLKGDVQSEGRKALGRLREIILEARKQARPILPPVQEKPPAPLPPAPLPGFVLPGVQSTNQQETVVLAEKACVPADINWNPGFREKLGAYRNELPADILAVFLRLPGPQQLALSFQFSLGYPLVEETDLERFIQDEAGLQEAVSQGMSSMKLGLRALDIGKAGQGGNEEPGSAPAPAKPVDAPKPKAKRQFSGFTATDKFRQAVAYGLVPPASDKELEKAFLEAAISDFQRSAVVCVYNVAQPSVSRADLDRLKGKKSGKKKKSAEEIAKQACREMREFIIGLRETKTRQAQEASFLFHGPPLGLPDFEKPIRWLDSGKVVEVFIPRNELLDLVFSLDPLAQVTAPAQESEVTAPAEAGEPLIIETPDTGKEEITEPEAAQPARPPAKPGPKEKLPEAAVREWVERVSAANLFDSDSVRTLSDGISAESVRKVLGLGIEADIPDDFVFELVFQPPISGITLGEYQARLFLLRCGGLSNKEAGEALDKKLNQACSMVYFLLPKAKDFQQHRQDVCFHDLLAEIQAVWNSHLKQGLERFFEKRGAPIPVCPEQMAQAMRFFSVQDRQILLLRLAQGLRNEEIRNRLGLPYTISHMPKKIAVLLNQFADSLADLEKRGASFAFAPFEIVEADEVAGQAGEKPAEGEKCVPVLSDFLALAVIVWTNKFQQAISPYLAKKLVLLQHPCQLAIALAGLSNTERLVIELSFGQFMLSPKEIVPRCNLKNNGVVQVTKRQALKKLALSIIEQGLPDLSWDQEPFYTAGGSSRDLAPSAADQEAWIREVLSVDFSSADSILSALRKIALSKLKKEMPEDLALLEQPEQLLDLLLMPPKYVLTFDYSYQGRVFLLAWGQIEIPTPDIARATGIKIVSVHRHKWLTRKSLREFFANLRQGILNKERVVIKGKERGKKEEEKIVPSLIFAASRLPDADFQQFLEGLAPEISRREMEDWLLAQFGLEPIGRAIEPLPRPRPAPIARPVPMAEPKPESSIAPLLPKEPQLFDIKPHDRSLAARLLQSPIFRGTLGIPISPDKLREILPKLSSVPYFQKRGLKPHKILEMRYLGNGKKGKPLSKGKIGLEFGEHTGTTVADWLKRIMGEIRRLAQEG